MGGYFSELIKTCDMCGNFVLTDIFLEFECEETLNTLMSQYINISTLADDTDSQNHCCTFGTTKG